jgi:tetratricopeptide (TPR) repeat protein
MDEDDAAAAEVDKWIRENTEFQANGAGIPKEELKQRIEKRFEPVRKDYEDFIKRHPNHVKVRLAYASFLGDLHDEDGEMAQLEKARELDPKDPATWNNLANYYGHNGPVTNAFVYYTKAIELDPTEPIYYHNFGTTVYLFRKDAREFYHINEQQVFDKAMMLYSNSMKYDPTNFPIATDVAQSYYGIKPMRTNDALVSWTNALKIAHDEIEREGVYLHFARLKTYFGRFDEARAHLNAVTNEMYAEQRKKLERNLEEKQSAATNKTTAVSEVKTNAALSTPPTQ